jgi:hypothetical protein
VHNVLDACISITWGSGRGLGPGILDFFEPQMALAYRLDAISQGPKNSRIPAPNPLPLPFVMDMHASKTLCMGLYKSYVNKYLLALQNFERFSKITLKGRSQRHLTYSVYS